MRINRVVYNNYCQLAGRDDKLGTGVIGVMAPNGAGKSNWVKGILRGLTGRTFNAGKNEDDVTWGESSGSIEIFFEVRGTPGRIKRDLKNSRCSMEFGDEKYKSATQIDEAIFNVLGITPKLLQEVVFVQQGAIEQILFQRPADRARSLQSLFGTEHVEKIRALLQDELTKYVVNSRVDVINQLKSEVKEIDVGIGALEKEKSSVSGDLLTPAQESKYQGVLQSSSSFSADKEQLSNAEQELANYRGQRADARRILSERAKTHTDLTTALSELRGQYERSRQTLFSYKELKVAADRQAIVKSRMVVLEAAVVKPMPEDPDVMNWGDLEFKKASSLPLKEQLSTWKFFLDSFGQQAESIRCPTCFQEVGSDYIKAVSHEYPIVKERVEALDLDIQFQESERRRITGEFTIWKQKMAAAQTELHALSVQLSMDPIVDLPDEANLNGMDQFCKSFENTEKLRLELEQQIAVNTEREKNMFNAETNAAMNVDKLRQRLAKEPKVEEVSKAQQVLAAHASARTVIARAEGSLEQLGARRTQVMLMLTQREAEEAKLEGIKTYRNLCERARTVLHRDNLPNMVAQAYMKAINAHLYQYLETFEVPYQAKMLEDTSILCNFGGTEIPAERLSGGQKVALGLTWRFAVHNMFVNNLGMMFLDEPTVYLDKDRIDSVYRLLERVKSYSKSAGLQVIVVTHEERLAGVFDQVINL